MSSNEAFADERAVTAGRLSYPPVLADFDDVEHAPTDIETLPVQPITDPDFGHPYGRSPVMHTLYDQADKVSDMPVTMFITGESSTGKESIARTVHDMSPYADQVFIAVDYGTISPNLIESELFGHEKGSFTSASQRYIGYFEHACGSTTFLDGITETPVEMQVKLLRVLETGVFMWMGGIEPIQTHAHIIAATNRNLPETVNDGAFREDLMYHLAMVPLHMSPLRDRGDSIRELALHFLAQFNAAHQTDEVFSHQILATLHIQTWPDNMRELRNAMHHGYILDEKAVEPVTSFAQTRGPTHSAVREGVLNLSAGVTLADAQRAMIMATLEHSHGNRRQVTKTLGVSLKTLCSRFGLYQNTAVVVMVA